MSFHRLHADIEDGRDLFVDFPFGDKLNDFALTHKVIVWDADSTTGGTTFPAPPSFADFVHPFTEVASGEHRAYGGEAGLQLMTELIELRRAGAPGTDRVIGIGMDSTELNVDPLSFAPAYRAAAVTRWRQA